MSATDIPGPTPASWITCSASPSRSRASSVENASLTIGAGVGRLDADSRVQLSIGSSGIPETFVLDGEGIIRHQHIGAITEGDVDDILAAFEDAR